MEEKIYKRIKKTLEFETSGETFSVEICLQNVSPNIEDKSLYDFLDVIYESVKKAIF